MADLYAETDEVFAGELDVAGVRGFNWFAAEVVEMQRSPLMVELCT